MEYILNTKGESFPKVPTVVFVDYETWLYGCNNQYGTEPDVSGWFNDVKDKGQIEEVWFFADLKKDTAGKHVLKLRNVSNNIIDCSKGESEKDYTDFIMLDHIYQKLIRSKTVEQFILFTGDGHFQSAIAFLKNFNDKIIGVYSLKGSLSSQLAETASWYVEVVPSNPKSEEMSEAIIKNLKWVHENNQGLLPTFKKTVEAVCMYNRGFAEKEVSSVLSDMIKKGVVRQVDTIIPSNGIPIRELVVNWEYVEN